MRPGGNSRTTLEKISWACASLVLLPSSGFPLSQSPSVSSKARGTPKVPTQRMVLLSTFISYILTRVYCRSAKSAEPPPPYPPPQSFTLLTAETVKNQIGLLRGYFEHRIAGQDTLPDDPQNPTQAKLGPLGQVMRPSGGAIAGGGSKKKAKPKDGAVAAALVPGVAAGPATGTVTAGTTVGVMSGVVAGVIQPATPVLSSAGLLSPLGGSAPVPSATAMVAAAIPVGSPQPQAQTPKKKKAAAGVGTGVGAGSGGGSGGGGTGGTGTGKKRGRPPEGLPPVVVASA